MSRHLDPDVVKQVKATLKSLEPVKRTMTAREAIAELEPDIREAMARGYSLEEIALRIGGTINISPNTLKGYLYRKETGGKAGKPAKPAGDARRSRSA
jgi:hypothetical protein